MLVFRRQRGKRGLVNKVLWKLANLLSLRLRQTTGKLIDYL